MGYRRSGRGMCVLVVECARPRGGLQTETKLGCQQAKVISSSWTTRRAHPARELLVLVRTARSLNT